jgi:hypothetical protein
MEFFLTETSGRCHPAQRLLVDRMSDEVTVSGIVVRKSGVPMIFVDSMK